jgi:hypothetical protein
VTSPLSPNLDALSERNYDATLERIKEARNLFIFCNTNFLLPPNFSNTKINDWKGLFVGWMFNIQPTI